MYCKQNKRPSFRDLKHCGRGVSSCSKKGTESIKKKVKAESIYSKNKTIIFVKPN